MLSSFVSNEYNFYILSLISLIHCKEKDGTKVRMTRNGWGRLDHGMEDKRKRKVRDVLKWGSVNKE